MPHALVSCSMDRWPQLALFLESRDLTFQLLDDLDPEPVPVQAAKARRPATRRPRSKPLVWKFKFPKPVFRGQSGMCEQCGHSSTVKMDAVSRFINPHASLCAGCTAVHLTSLLHAVPHKGEHAPFGDFDPERNIPYAAIRERIDELRGLMRESA